MFIQFVEKHLAQLESSFMHINLISHALNDMQ
jgi:hypothetical protein